MLTCRDVEVMLQDYLDGYLLPSQREVLERHLRRCPACSDLLAGLARIDDRIDGIDEVEVPDIAGAVLARLPPGTYGPSPLRRYVAWAAVPLAVVLFTGAAALFEGRYRLEEKARARVVEVVFTAPTAESVAVVGDFNRWNPSRNVMVREGRAGTWRARLRVPPGVYQYGFVVDGREWLADPTAPRSVPDGFGGRNSVLVVDG